MRYDLRIWAAGYGPGVAISSTEYENLVAAKQRIYLAADVEEKLDLLLENYFEYERELLSLSLQSSLFTPIDEHRVFREAQLINRRTVNLLTAARMYIDQVKHSVSKYAGSDNALDVAALLSAQYEQYLEYRVAEALRNHTQHRALPVHRMKWSSAWEELNSPEERLRSCVIPIISLEELVSEGDFKASVLRELQASGKQYFSLTRILRRYVESLAAVHVEVRRSLSRQADIDHQTIMAALDRARTELSEDLVAIVVAAGEDEENPQEHHFISERSWTRRQTLIRKNSSLTKLSRRYVSAEHPGDTA